VPTAAFSTLLLNQSLWMKDDLSQRRQSFCVSTIFSILVLSVAAIALHVRDRSAGMFYPHFVFIAAI